MLQDKHKPCMSNLLHGIVATSPWSYARRNQEVFSATQTAACARMRIPGHALIPRGCMYACMREYYLSKPSCPFLVMLQTQTDGANMP